MRGSYGVENKDMNGNLRKKYPNLVNYRVTSQATENYNCVAWALKQEDVVWWPDPWEPPLYRWPDDIPRSDTLPSFLAFFKALNFTECGSSTHEEGFIKIAIYTNDNCVTHVARLCSNGKWTSKLGGDEDIEHTLEELVGPWSGQPICYLKKKIM